MGVRKLNKFLTNKELIITHNNLRDFINTKHDNKSNNSHNGKIVIAIDFWLYAHKFLHSCKSDNILLGFWNQIMKFFLYGIIPLYVLDGSVPVEKHEKMEERIRKRINCKNKIDDIDDEISKYININDIEFDEDNLNMLYDKKAKLQRHIKRIKTHELYNIYKLV